jgi:hypothetical protein
MLACASRVSTVCLRCVGVGPQTRCVRFAIRGAGSQRSMLGARAEPVHQAVGGLLARADARAEARAAEPAAAAGVLTGAQPRDPLGWVWSTWSRRAGCNQGLESVTLPGEWR